MKLSYVFILMGLLLPAAAYAAEGGKSCAPNDRSCLFSLLEETAVQITESSWQDTTWREMAKLLTHEGQTDRALSLVSRIKSPDTQAMTIRAIGITAAEKKLDKAAYADLFAKLKAEAAKISHAPSFAIAINYIADAQALSGDDDSAFQTAMSLDNPEMRNKALYDCAKIQAENNRQESVKRGVRAIDDPGFRNKAWRTVSKIRADEGDYEGGLQLSREIDNPYQKAQAVLYILVRQITPEEVSIE